MAEIAARRLKAPVEFELSIENVDKPPLDYLAAAGWPTDSDATDPGGAVVIVAHQPVLGLAASRLLTGIEQPVSVRKAAAWWFTRRERGGSARCGDEGAAQGDDRAQG